MLAHVGENVKCTAVQTVKQFLKTLSIELSYDPAIPLLGIYLK